MPRPPQGLERVGAGAGRTGGARRRGHDGARHGPAGLAGQVLLLGLLTQRHLALAQESTTGPSGMPANWLRNRSATGPFQLTVTTSRCSRCRRRSKSSAARSNSMPSCLSWSGSAPTIPSTTLPEEDSGQAPVDADRTVVRDRSRRRRGGMACQHAGADDARAPALHP